jgi:hypothetical protein
VAEQQPKEIEVNPYAPLTAEQTAAQNDRISTLVEDSSRQTSQPTYSPVIEEIFGSTPTYVDNTLGSHNPVAKGLSRITFLEGGGMSESIAYIRYWTRSGSKEKSALNKEELNSYAQSTTGLKEFYAGANISNTLYENNPYLSNEGFKGVYDNSFSSFDTSKIQLAGVNPADSSLPQTNFAQIATSDSPILPPGSVYSANPGGGAQVTPAESPEGAVWQFLFNPEELEMSYGPEFNRGETWGVSDEANSGQPLSWKYNKNKKLVFSRILLHGYSIGRRVDSLEKGLRNLFTARDGNNGSDGPPVLEFVWGNRVFGPCVIQNISVREKAWDNGLLVNAEVSFELEQVPEWTINDGFVDILRPGRQPVLNDPTSASESFAEQNTTSTGSSLEGGENTENKNRSGGGGGNPEPYSVTYKKCKEAGVYTEKFKQLAESLSNVNIMSVEMMSSNPTLESVDLSLATEYKLQRLRDYINLQYKKWIKVFSSAESALKSEFTNRLTGYAPEEVRERFKKKIDAANFDVNNVYNIAAYLRTAIQKSQAASKNVYDSAKCRRSRSNESKYAENKRKERLCKLKAGDTCFKDVKAGQEVRNSCTKKIFVCGKNGVFS